jgi:putative ABC transport system substrate-binding protein
MRRREFIAAIGVGPLFWPWPAMALAQPTAGSKRIGVLMTTPESDSVGQANVSRFKSRLAELGWHETGNLAMEVRWAGADPNRIAADAMALMRGHPDILFVQGPPGLLALRQLAGSVPIVFSTVSDPVSAGFVQSLAKPGGTITGFAQFEFSIAAKWLDLLREGVPELRRVSVLQQHPQTPQGAGFTRAVESHAQSLGIETIVAGVNGAEAIERAILVASEGQTGSGLIVLPGPVTRTNRDVIIAALARVRLPAIFSYREAAQNGGLISYGIDSSALYAEAAGYTDRILRGANPSELPIQNPTKFELVINAKTAAELDLTIPPALLASADEVIE